MNDQTTRLYSLDALRATMMLLGIVIHTVISYAPVDFGEVWSFQDPDQTIWALVILALVHAFRMQVFFVLAGFFTALMIERRGAPGLIRNRFQRIVIPFVVGLAILWPMIVTAFVFASGAVQGSVAQGIDAVSQVPTIAFLIPQKTTHLWFIYFLIFYYPAWLVLSALARRLPLKVRESLQKLFGSIASRPLLRIAVLTLISVLTLLPLGGRLDADTSFLPNIIILTIYFVYFAFGALLYQHRQLIVDFTRLAWTQVIIASVVLLGFFFMLLPTLELDEATLGLLKSVVNAFCAWMFVFGLIGLFVRYLDHPSARFRYAVDASYWVYLIHLPVVVTVSGLLATTSLSVWPKMFVAATVTTIIGFATYNAFVRSTFIGKSLNGRRYPRGLPANSEV